jgi:hypothetical protein
MAVQNVAQVIDRLGQDSSFMSEYCADPARALSRYRLTTDEARALRAGDGFELELLGLGEKWAQFVETVCGPNPGP